MISIETFAIVAGKMPPRALGLIVEWAAQHQNELRQLWEKAQTMQTLGKIPPLK